MVRGVWQQSRRWFGLALVCFHCAAWSVTGATPGTRAEPAASGPAAGGRQVPWPVATGALAVGMVFVMAWMQARHRRRVEQSNLELRRSEEETRRMLQASRESESKFRLLFEASSDAILIVDPERQVFIDCNPAALKMAGGGREWLLAQPIANLSPERQPDGQLSAERIGAVIRRALREGTQRFEWLARRFTGEDFPVEVLLTPIRRDGRTLLVTVARDITERKQAETVLRESQQLLASITDNISEAIYRSTRDHRLIFVNAAYLRLFGYASLEELQQFPREVLYAQAAERVHLLELLETEGGFRNQEVEFVRKDGTRFWGLCSSVAIFEPGTRTINYYVGTIADITSQKRMEAELRASEQRWRLLFEQSPLSVQIFSPDGWSHRVNAAWKRLFRLTDEEAARFNVLADPQLEAAGALAAIRRAFAGEVVSVPPVPFTVRPATGAAGETRWIGALLFPLHDAAGRVLEVVCVHEDITERKQAEDEVRQLNQELERRVIESTAELRASEARLRTLVEHAPEAIVVFDGDTGRFLNCNENATRLYGRSREELYRLTPPEVSPPLQADGRPSVEVAWEKIRQALAGATPVFEWLHCHADGRVFPCEIRLVRLPDESRHLVRASIFDTSERRRREKIQQATYRISEAVHMASDLESLYREIHDIVKDLMPADNFYIALFEARTEMISFPYYVDEASPTAPAPRKLTTGLTGYVLRTGKPLLVDHQTVARKKQVGDAVVLEGLGDLAYVESGTPSAIWLGVPLTVQNKPFGVMAVQDYRNARAYREEEKQILTFVAEQTALAIERKRAEQALRESEEKHRALFETTSQGVMLHDEEKFLEVNPATVRIMGYERAEDIIGKHPAETSAPIQMNGEPADVLAKRHIGECMARGTARFEWLARSPKGKDVPLEVILTRVQMQGRPIIQAVIHDISERKQAEAELLRSLAREKELSALKSNFVSMVSHEFRTPLGIIMSSAEILDEYFEQLDPLERRDHLQSIHKNTRRMANLMEEVLLLSRVEAGKLVCDPAPLDLHGFCRRLTDEVLSATNRRCPIEVAVDAPAAEVLADERLLRHVFTNLLGNAVKYSPAGEPVAFTVERRDGPTVFRIADRGIGIPEADQEWLFKAFHRGRNVGQVSGTGLGLVIVKRCVELHGGQIRIDSAVGSGTTATVTLPLSVHSTPTLA